MKIQIQHHALVRAKERGTNFKEIMDVLRSGSPIPAKYDRKGKAKIFDFKQKRLNDFYEQKRVEIFYTEDNDDIIILIAFVFYGKWE
jgi:hypothetical protein